MAFALAALTTSAAAQSSSPFDPTPVQNQRFDRAPDPTRRSQPSAIPAPKPASAGDTGFDATGSIRKKKQKKRKPGDPFPPPPEKLVAPVVQSGAPQQADGSHVAPQIASRAVYANAYKPPDAIQRRPLPPNTDPFEPVGVRVGEFLLKPSIEVSRGLDTNVTHVPGGPRSWFTVITPELQAKSEWSRHELGATLRGSYTAFDSVSESNRPSVDSKVYGRLDVTRDTQFNGEGRFLLGTDYPGSPNIPAGIAKLPIFTTVGATAGVTQRFNHLEVSLKGSFDRTTYQDSQLTDGSTFSNHDRDFNQYAGAGRISYELTPGFKPFFEFDADRRVHDLTFDRNGVQRDSSATTPKVGATFEMTRILTGEVSIGYITRTYKDPNLEQLKGLTADASLVWIASGLTTATLTASSRAEETVLVGVSGALRRDVGLQIDHSFRRWLIGTLKFGYGFDQYVGLGRDDKRATLSGAMTYKFSRELSLKGEVREDWLRSNVAGVDYTATTFLIGLKYQR